MAILASAIVAKAATALNDPTFTRWTQAELLASLNVVRRQAASIRPDLFISTSIVKLIAGARQALPADGHMLFRLHSNMGTNGITVGDAIYPASREHMDFNQPSWRKTTPTDAVECFMYDMRTPLEYYVSPPNTGNGYVELSYGAVPADITASAAIGCADVYEAALLSGVLAWAYSKPQETGGNVTLAAAHFAAFQNALSPKAA